MSADVPAVPVEALLEHRFWVRELARSLVSDDSRADDAAQETWLSAVKSPPRDPSTVRGWLATVVANHARKLSRGERRRDAREAGVAVAAAGARAESAHDLVERAETHKRLVEALLALEEPYRGVLLLRYYEDLTPTEIAARLAVPVDTVKTRQKRGIARLRERLDEGWRGDRRRWCAALMPLAGFPRAAAPTVAGAAGAGAAWKLGLGVVAVAGAIGVAVLAGGGGNAPAPGGGAQVAAAPAPRPAPRRRAQPSDGAKPAADASADDAAAPQAPPAPPVDDAKPAAPAADRVAIAVRDLADGSWLRDFKLKARGAAGASVEFVTDGSGSATVDAAAADSLAPRDGDWSLPQYAAGEVRKAGVLWVYRTVGVDGTVDDEDVNDPVNLASVELSALVSAPLQSSESTEPWTLGWLSSHRVGGFSSTPLPHPDVNGRFFARVPGVKGVAIVARAAGRQNCRVSVTLPPRGGDAAPVRLVLRSGLRVAGQIVDGDGKPVAHLALKVEVALDGAALADAVAAISGRGGTIMGGADGTFAGFVCETDADGRFTCECPVDGIASVWAYPPAPYGGIHRSFGRVSQVSAPATIVVRSRPESVVAFARDGAALARARLTVYCRSRGEPPAFFQLTTDDSGRVSTRAFDPGCRYSVVVMDSNAGAAREFEWTNQEALDLDQLKK